MQMKYETDKHPPITRNKKKTPVSYEKEAEQQIKEMLKKDVICQR